MEAIACSACSSVNFAASAASPQASACRACSRGPPHGGEDGSDRLLRLLVGELRCERAEPLAERL